MFYKNKAVIERKNKRGETYGHKNIHAYRRFGGNCIGGDCLHLLVRRHKKKIAILRHLLPILFFMLNYVNTKG